MEPSRPAELAELWQDRLATMARNITDFAQADDFVRIRGRLADPAHAYRGRSLEAARAAVTAVDALWQDFLLLSRVIDQASALKARGSLFGRSEEAVRQLVEGPSIRLPAVAVPVRQRSLLDAAEATDRVTPAQLLAGMTTTFDAARQAVAALLQAETVAQLKLGSLRHAWQAAAAADPPDGASVDFARLAAEAEADPLEAGASLAALGQALTARRARAAEAARLREGLVEGLGEARSALAEVAALCERVAALRAEHARTLDGAAGPAAPTAATEPGSDTPHSLKTWLDRLDAAAAGPHGEAAAVGLKRWQEAARASAAAGQAALAALGCDLADYATLRGRFRALQVKAAQVMRRGAADPALARLEAEVAAELGRKPCRLDAARRSFEDYARHLAGQDPGPPPPDDPERPA